MDPPEVILHAIQALLYIFYPEQQFEAWSQCKQVGAGARRREGGLGGGQGTGKRAGNWEERVIAYTIEGSTSYTLCM